MSRNPVANSARRALGRGLSDLLGDLARPAAAPGVAPPPAAGLRQTLREVPLAFLRPGPFQPRRHFGEEEIAQLARSLAAQGLVQPILVRPRAANLYEIVAGERRFRAAQKAGLHKVPVVIREVSDQEALEIALVENLQRAALTPVEEARALDRLRRDFGHSQEEIARALGRSRAYVANMVRLLALPAPLLRMIEEGRLSAGHARALLAAPDPEALARAVLARGLNVRQTERLAQSAAGGKSAGAKNRAGAPDLAARDFAQRLSGQLGLPVRLVARRGGGELRIAWRGLDQLEDLARRLSRPPAPPGAPGGR